MTTCARRSAGFTLVEIMIALSILVVSIIGLVAVITYTTTQNEINRENQLAMRAAEAKLEEMRQWDVSTIHVRYTVTNPTQLLSFPLELQNLDPNGTPTTLPNAYYPGPDFSAAIANDLSMRRLQFPSAVISFPKDPNNPGSLRLYEEYDVLKEPDEIARDLNFNKIPDDPTGDYRVLPVTITIKWSGIRGPRELVYRYMFLRRS